MGYASAWCTLTAKCQTFVAVVSWAAGPGRAAAPEESGSSTACALTAGTPACPQQFYTPSVSTTHSPTHTTKTPSTTLFHVSLNTSLNTKYCSKVFSRATLDLYCCNRNLRRTIRQTLSYWNTSLKLLQFSRVYNQKLCKMLQSYMF